MLARWFKTQFIDPHSRRDVDLEHWWQMPDDPTRTASPWRQLVNDLTAPAAFSEWHERVAETRVRDYDRLRPPVTRAAFLGCLFVTLWVVRAPGWCWTLLTPAATQVVLEIYLFPYLPNSAPASRWRPIRWMRKTASDHFQTKLLNVTGVIGTIACPLNVVAVSFSPPGGDLGWIKVSGLAGAIFYLNSGLGNTCLDPPNYTEASEMPPVMHWIRPYAPLISFIIVTGIVHASVTTHRWELAMIPIAYLCAALTLLLGSTIRNHDRMMAAAIPVARSAVEAGRKDLGGIVHDDLGPAKAAAESASRAQGVSYKDAIDLEALSAYLTHFKSRIGIFASQRIELPALVRKIVGPYGISPRDVAYDVDWDEAALRKEDHKTAVRMTTALIHNVGQTLQRPEHGNVRKAFVLEGRVSGSGRELRYHLAVRDYLPLISEEHWCVEGGTLEALRSWLREDFNGDLTQVSIGDGTKRIVASWGDRPPLTGYGDPSFGGKPA